MLFQRQYTLTETVTVEVRTRIERVILYDPETGEEYEEDVEVSYSYYIVKGRKGVPDEYDDDYDDNDSEGFDEDDGYDYKGAPDDSSHITESGDEMDE